MTIGANATIICGTTLHEHAFIAAGAVVTKDVPAFALMGGVPAKQLGWMSRYGEQIPVIPRSLQLIAGRSGQEYNQRKKRKGAFWEDRYHATAVDVDEHLVRCMIYLDFHPVKCRNATPALAGFHWVNMVRNKVVNHPKEWSYGGYPEIIKPQQRYRIIDRALLKKLLDIDDNLSAVYSGWVQTAVDESSTRQPGWTESVAVGGKDFVEKVKEMLGGRACGRRVHEVIKTGSYALNEPVLAYNDVFEGKMFTP